MPTCHHDGCPTTPTQHVLTWAGGHVHALFTCPDHTGTTGVPRSLHPIGPDCTRPGAQWLISYCVDSYCGNQPADPHWVKS